MRRPYDVLSMLGGQLLAGFLVALALFDLSDRGALAAQQAKRPASTQATSQPERRSSKQFALNLVASAVETAEESDPDSQGFLLFLAGDAVSAVDPEKAKEYYTSSFEATEKMAQSYARLGLQQVILARSMNLDLDQALHLLDRMDTPDITTHPGVDVRVGSARVIVERLLQRNSPDDVDKALGLLRYLGDTGQYPYAAAGEVIKFFHQRGEDWRGADVFSEATNYFRMDDRFGSSADQFVELCSESEGKVPNNVLVTAIRTVLDLGGGRERAGAETQGEQGAISAPAQDSLRIGRTAYLASRLLPIAMRLDAKTAREEAERYAALQQSMNNRRHQAPRAGQSDTSVFVEGESSSEKQEESYEQSQDARTLQKVLELAGKDAEQAKARAEEIQLPGYRSRALAAIARNLAKGAPGKAISLLQEAQSLVENVDSAQALSVEELLKVTGEKVEALADIAEAWERLGDARKASALVGEAFLLALNLREKQAAILPMVPGGFGVSANLLRRLAQVETYADPTHAAKRAESISDPRLRAFVLLGIAKHILQEKTAS